MLNLDEYKAALALSKMNNVYNLEKRANGILLCDYGKSCLVVDEESGVLKVLKRKSAVNMKYAVAADNLKQYFGIQSTGYEIKALNLIAPFYGTFDNFYAEYSSKQDVYVLKSGAAKTVHDYFTEYLNGDAKAGEFVKTKHFVFSLMRIVLFRYIIGSAGNTSPSNILVDPKTNNLISINEFGGCPSDNKLLTQSSEHYLVEKLMNLIVSKTMKITNLNDYFDVNTMFDILKQSKDQKFFIGFEERFNELKKMFQ